MSDYEAREGEARLESAGAVQIMSVHKSKGLEFPLVVLGDASYARRGGSTDLLLGSACKVYDEGEAGLVSTYAYKRAERTGKGARGGRTPPPVLRRGDAGAGLPDRQRAGDDQAGRSQRSSTDAG